MPRTSGSTLNSILTRQYRRREIHVEELFNPSDIERFVALPESYRRRIRLLKGHMAFGLHRQLPQPARYFTMVRDPIGWFRCTTTSDGDRKLDSTQRSWKTTSISLLT
ncbi:MAG TPA: hypothetical protein VNP73_00615 [Actinomycetota bacterium]|nr:hypothetical protein [Actinomycetota bacterium]